MAKSWRARQNGRGPTSPPYAAQPHALEDDATTAGPSWRYRLLLLAIGSALPDGSDVTAHDRRMLLKMDQHLIRRAAVLGEAAAHAALLALVEILRADNADLYARVH
jgi:hypothetical protein